MSSLLRIKGKGYIKSLFCVLKLMLIFIILNDSVKIY